MQRSTGQKSCLYTPRAGAPSPCDSLWAGRAVNGKPKCFQELESGIEFSRERLNHWVIQYGEQSPQPSFFHRYSCFSFPPPFFLFFTPPLCLCLRVFLFFRYFPSSVPGLPWFPGDYWFHKQFWGGRLFLLLSKMGFVLSLNNLHLQIMK